MSKTCPSCGKTHEAAERCPYCNAPVPVEPVPEQAPDSKETRIIKAKIATKKQQIDDISQVGPVLLVVFGFLVCLTFIGIILGLILIGIGIWWSSSRENEKKKLQNEIAELEAELE